MPSLIRQYLKVVSIIHMCRDVDIKSLLLASSNKDDFSLQ